MLLKMIKATQKNAAVKSILIARREELQQKSASLYLIFTAIIDADYETAQSVMNALASDSDVFEVNGITIKKRHAEGLIEKLEKNVFRVRREFSSINDYRVYAEKNAVGKSWDDEVSDAVFCYEYLLEEKAEEASITALFLSAERLAGTPKQQAWAEQIRAEKFAQADANQVDKLSQQLSAKWWIENKDLTVAELAKKRITTAKPVVKHAEQAKTDQAEFTLEDSKALIAEKVAALGEARIKADLFDACFGNKGRADAIFNGEAKLNSAELKSFFTYVQ